MLFAVFYLLLRRLVALAGAAEDRHNDIEVLVLREGHKNLGSGP